MKHFVIIPMFSGAESTLKVGGGGCISKYFLIFCQFQKVGGGGCNKKPTN